MSLLGWQGSLTGIQALKDVEISRLFELTEGGCVPDHGWRLARLRFCVHGSLARWVLFCLSNCFPTVPEAGHNPRVGASGVGSSQLRAVLTRSRRKAEHRTRPGCEFKSVIQDCLERGKIMFRKPYIRRQITDIECSTPVYDSSHHTLQHLG